MKILFTVAFLDGLHGSVKHVLEYSSFLASKEGGSHNVSVSSIIINNEIKRKFVDRYVHVCQLFKTDVSYKYDIVFSYHFPTIEYLLQKGLKSEKLILGSLSGFVDLETFPLWWNIASLLTVMSEECRISHHEKYHIPLDCMNVFENSIPDEFYTYNFMLKNSKYPKNIAVVSNHIPDELLKTYDIFRKRGINVDFIGVNQKIYTEITPQILSNYDLIVSIGKTIQYGLGMGLPVYEYDHFGGNGYINRDNIDKEMYYNFTGRPDCRFLSEYEIVHEIIEGYSSACIEAPFLKKIAGDKFLLSIQMRNLMALIEKARNFAPENVGKVCYNHTLNIVHGAVFAPWIFSKIQELENKQLITDVHFSSVKNIFYLYIRKKINKILKNKVI